MPTALLLLTVILSGAKDLNAGNKSQRLKHGMEIPRKLGMTE